MEEKDIYISFVIKPKRIKVIIKNDGAGFDPAEVSDPLLPQNLLQRGGKGIAIMRACFDQVKYSSKGRVVTMVKNKKSEDR
jgi:serine/threonine-protein kinase RsbW